MIKKHLINSILLIVFLFLGLCFFTSLKTNKQESLKHLDEIESLRSRVLLQSYYSGYFRFPKDYNLQPINGDSKGVIDVFPSFKVVLYINSNHCDSCIDKFIDRMEKQFIKHSDMKYIIISKGFTLRELNLMKTDKNIKAPIYSIDNSEELPFINKMDKALFPYYFTVDSSLEVSNILFPIKPASVIEDRYFEQLMSK